MDPRRPIRILSLLALIALVLLPTLSAISSQPGPAPLEHYDTIEDANAAARAEYLAILAELTETLRELEAAQARISELEVALADCLAGTDPPEPPDPPDPPPVVEGPLQDVLAWIGTGWWTDPDLAADRADQSVDYSRFPPLEEYVDKLPNSRGVVKITAPGAYRVMGHVKAVEVSTAAGAHLLLEDCTITTPHNARHSAILYKRGTGPSTLRLRGDVLVDYGGTGYVIYGEASDLEIWSEAPLVYWYDGTTESTYRIWRWEGLLWTHGKTALERRKHTLRYCRAADDPGGIAWVFGKVHGPRISAGDPGMCGVASPVPCGRVVLELDFHHTQTGTAAVSIHDAHPLVFPANFAYHGAKRWPGGGLYIGPRASVIVEPGATWNGEPMAPP